MSQPTTSPAAINQTPSATNQAVNQDYQKDVRRADLIIGIIILIVGIIIVGILFFLGLRERRFYQECNNNPSNYCMQFGCAGAGDLCGNSAIRYNEDQTQYACANLPTTWVDVPTN